MPILPSGRRIEFSLDRFHAMLEMLPETQATQVVESLTDAGDLLWVLDLVAFDPSGRPCFMDCVAANWNEVALDWPAADRNSFSTYLKSESARNFRIEAIEDTRVLHSRIKAQHASNYSRQLAA